MIHEEYVKLVFQLKKEDCSRECDWNRGIYFDPDGIEVCSIYGYNFAD